VREVPVVCGEPATVVHEPQSEREIKWQKRVGMRVVAYNQPASQRPKIIIISYSMLTSVTTVSTVNGVIPRSNK